MASKSDPEGLAHNLACLLDLAASMFLIDPTKSSDPSGAVVYVFDERDYERLGALLIAAQTYGDSGLGRGGAE